MAITAGVVGAGMIAGGTAAAIRAQQMKTKPRGVQYGGSQEARKGYLENYGERTDAGAARVNDGKQLVGQAGGLGSQLASRGLQTMDSANNVQLNTPSYEAKGLLAGYTPGAASAAQAQQVLDQNARANLAAAQSGGAMARRAAINANAMAGVQSAADVAALRAQEEQAYLGARIAQANEDQGMLARALEVQEAQRLGRLTTGAQVATGGNAQALTAGTNQMQAGLMQEKTYLDAIQSVEEQQMAANLDFERRRQADQQRKAQNLWGLGSTLIGGGAKVLGNAGGGGGGG